MSKDPTMDAIVSALLNTADDCIGGRDPSKNMAQLFGTARKLPQIDERSHFGISAVEFCFRRGVSPSETLFQFGADSLMKTVEHQCKK
jgi:hypothetical protein